MEEIKITESVREMLRYALLDEQDLRDSLKDGMPEEVVEEDGSLRCKCFLAVRRQFDPETAELRQLEASYRRNEDGIEVFNLEGLDPPPEVDPISAADSG